MVQLQEVKGERSHLCQRLLNSVTHPNYQPTLSTFYPTDFLRSAILSIYLLVMCGLWSVLLQRARFFDESLPFRFSRFVSSLTEYSLDAPQLTQYLPDHFTLNYSYTRLVQILALLVAFPMIYKYDIDRALLPAKNRSHLDGVVAGQPSAFSSRRKFVSSVLWRSN